MKHRFYIQAFFVTAICCFLNLQTQAFLWWGNDAVTSPSHHKQVVMSSPLTFSVADFWDNEKLASITIVTLPQDYYGLLLLDDIPVQATQIISVSSLPSVTFEAKSTLGITQFQYIPTYFDGSSGETVTLTLEVLDLPNLPPIANDMDLFTYKNIEIVCYFDVTDPESDFLTFQIIDSPSRGSVTLSDNGASSFLYTPYENKVGKDKFSYVVIDSSGNRSNEATVQLQIEKADTPVYYSDMTGHSAHKAAISLAESGIYVGECVGNTYLFSPDQTVSRQEFLSLAMSVTQNEPLSEVTTTGFYDDDTIATWSKGYVSSAVMSGVIEGSTDQQGRPVFQGDASITYAEASVILNKLLEIPPITEVQGYHWASQATANLSAVGVSTASSLPLPSSLNRGEVAELLDGALALMKTQKDTWLPW